MNQDSRAQEQSVNRKMMLRLCVIAAVMFGFGYALVPLYRTICELTGINVLAKKESVQRGAVSNTQLDRSRKITVELDSNSQGPWKFVPEQRYVEVYPGELVHVNYTVTNQMERQMQGQAIPSYAPSQAVSYFNKLECFCFKQQVFKPSEQRVFPVVFVIDPKLPPDVKTITLSYTFFEVAGLAQESAR